MNLRTGIVLAVLVLLVAVLQVAILPEFFPKSWRPDLGLAIGLASLSFLKRETALTFIFALGLQADLLLSERLGLLTTCYLTAAWILLAFEHELIRGGASAAWFAAVFGSACARLLYVFGGQCFGMEMGLWDGCKWAGMSAVVMAVASIPVIWCLQSLYVRMEILSVEAREIHSRRPRRKGWLAG